MSKLIDLTGKKFGRLTVLQRAGKDSRRNSTWLCQCDCGNECVVVGYDLRSGHTKSCGCLHTIQFTEMTTKHGGRYSRLYLVWKSMRNRCTYAKSSVYKHYGGRGIKVCDEWLHSFAAFREWAMQTGYDETAPRGKCTIDRINVDGDYCPEN